MKIGIVHIVYVLQEASIVFPDLCVFLFSCSLNCC
jgi:hypothetical protein